MYLFCHFLTTDKCRICSEANAVLIDCILCFQDEGLLDSEKIAAFDFDGCLAKTSVKRYVLFMERDTLTVSLVFNS